MSNRVYILDTHAPGLVSRSPGCSMTVPEKLRMARKLVSLAWISSRPASPSPPTADFEAVDAGQPRIPHGSRSPLGAVVHARCRSARRLAQARQTAAQSIRSSPPVRFI
jgi:2-isopropylmalate synthase